MAQKGSMTHCCECCECTSRNNHTHIHTHRTHTSIYTNGSVACLTECVYKQDQASPRGQTGSIAESTVCLVALTEMWHSLLGTQSATLQHWVGLPHTQNHTIMNQSWMDARAMVLTENSRYEDLTELKLNLPTRDTRQFPNPITIRQTSPRLHAMKCLKPHTVRLNHALLVFLLACKRRPEKEHI